MIVVVFALIVPSTTTTNITTNATQVYSVYREEHLVQQFTKYLQGITPLASALDCFA